MKIFWKYITLLILLVVLGCDDEQYYQGFPMTSKMEVSQQGSDGKENGYDYVDLGLPSGLKWATCNVGASKPEEYGEYFAWGETTPKSSYSWSNLKYCLDSSGDKFSKYVSSSSHGTVDSKKTLELSDDAARANWGGRWRMPTSTEIDELLNNCTWVWTTQNGVKGYRVTGTKAGYTDRSIFLPAAGYRSGGNLSTTGSFGIYWSSSLNTSYSRSAYDLYFSSSDHYREYNNRYFGLSVRPVCPSGSYVSVTGVKLNTTSVSLEVGDTTTLTATVSPSNATDKSVTWKSSNTSVATVDSNGKITAKSAGTATITVTTTDGNKTATCTVTVKSKSADGKENGHDYVDLGLPSGLKWATCNVGASKPEEYGSYFAWGETTAKSSYTDSNYGYSSNPLTLPLDKDAASVNWGGSWRMPTSTEIDELLNNCTWTWTTLNGVNGYKVTSKKAGYTDKFIFLPAAGDFIKNNLDYVGSDGHYWSSSISSDSYHADVLYFYSGSHYRRDIFNRYCGLSVRPVCPSGSYVSVTGVKLNTTSMSLEVGDTTTLTATVSPSYATDKSVTWKSNNTSVAIVDSIGKITAKSDGTAVITVTTTDGNFTATCIVTVTSQSADGKENGYDYVDLGLPSGLKWATCNVGAGKPEDYGSYFAWGETTAKSSYDWENLKYHTSGDSYENVKFSKYVSDSNYGTIDNRTTLELSDDAARANWGGSWRMPTDAEFGELINNCTWTWTTQNGVNGYKVTSKKSGYTDKSIFLPAAGFRSNGSLRNAGSNGYYWSSSLDTYYSGLACVLYFDSSSHDRGYSTRFCGRSVRPVCPSGSYVSVTGVKLNTTSMSLEVGDTTTLTATVSPSNATDKRVTWKSSNTTVATVDSYGKVTAKSAGTATITVTTTDGSNTSTCTVTVTSPQSSSDGSENGHDYVDLGLPSGVKWATCNIGASKPEEYGSYFAWGETTTKSSYTESNYGYTSNPLTLPLDRDAARANWGGSWRMPTTSEIDELLNNCTWTWTTQNGVSGYKVTGKKSGYTDKSIFLPAAGCRSNDILSSAGSNGHYWSSSLGTSYSNFAYALYFNSDNYGRNGYLRYCGRSVRPVCPSGSYVSVTGVKLNTTSVSLEVGDTTTLTATVSPSNATDKSVTWKSSNTTVATVDSNGKVTAESAGTATITVTTTDGSNTATCTVTVKTPQIVVTSVSLNTSSLSLEVGGTTTLTATVSPSNATDKSVTWTSDNTSVATVDSIGNVTAKSAGTATITVTTTDGNTTATCTVTVKTPQSSDGKENGYDYVDLGLPSGIKWATCNVGASMPEDYGVYFAWGETTSKNNYSWSNLKYCLDSNGDKFSKYVSSSSYGTVDNKITLELSDDAARANWGGSWRMPTNTEISELLNNCTWTWTTQNGVKGYKVTSNKTGYTDKSIFLPAAGCRYDDTLLGAGSSGYYWSSSLGTGGSGAYELDFGSGSRGRYGYVRYYGLSVRPVCPSEGYVSVTSVSLNTSSLSLEVGGTTTLTATVSPSNATDNSVQWSSSNTDVASVDEQGNVTAKSAGTATITVTTTDGSITASCTVTVKTPQIVVTGVALNTTSVSLEIGGTTTLTATVSPSNATDKSVQWNSSNTDVATVDEQGNVTAKSAGTAVITVTTTDGNITASCTVTVKSQQSSEDKENGHEYVDLGLRVKWATCNVGATCPEEYGDYFAWGETTSKNNYSWSNLKYCLDSNGDKFSKYVSSSSYGTVDNKITLELSDDAARANWGGSWRMPTNTEISELLNNCTWTWTTQNGVKGYKVTSLKTGYTDKSIFIPVAGYRIDDSWYNAWTHGIYWSSSLSSDYGRGAYVLYLTSGSHYRDNADRDFGLSVRPVCPSDNYVSVTGVELNTTSLSLETGGTATLTATVSPSDATDKSVQWSSSNTSVATVDTNGKITAKSDGTATITVTTTDGNITATCTVTVTSPQSSDDKENGHDYVDLGLPSGLKWATCNIGATKPEEYGDYFAWGETTAKSSYDWENLKYRTSGDSYVNVKFSKYVYSSSYGTVDNRTTLELSDDAARANWGGSWRMPTATEIDELLNNCTWEWTTQNGVNGYKVTGKKSGYTDKSIFLPAAGCRNSDDLNYAGSYGSYWSSSLYTTLRCCAYVLYFGSGGHGRGNDNRCCGQSVRPVCP